MGLKENNTLEVYRTRPRVEYLGRLVLRDVYHHTAVGRLMRVPGTPPPRLQVGDAVASKIQ